MNSYMSVPWKTLHRLTLFDLLIYNFYYYKRLDCTKLYFIYFYKMNDVRSLCVAIESLHHIRM